MIPMDSHIKTSPIIDLSKHFRINLRGLTLIPCMMILFAIVRICMDITIVDLTSLSYLLLGLVLLSFVIMTYLCVRSGRISIFLLMTILAQAIVFISSLINATYVKNSIYEGCTIILMVMLIEYYKERIHIIIIAFAIAFSVCVYLNLFHMLTHPELLLMGEEKNIRGFLLGDNYNAMGSRMLFAIAMNVVCLKFSKWWLLNLIPIIIISLGTVLFVGSMTSTTVISLFLLYCLIPNCRMLKIGIVALMSMVFLFQIFVCFQGKGIENNELAVYFIEDILGKDITFTQRTFMWDSASKIFVLSPLYGYGYVHGEWYYSNMSSHAMGPHNYIWSLLIYGGILLLSVFTYISYLSFRRIIEIDDRIILLLYALSAVWFLMGTMEASSMAFIIIPLAIVYFIPNSYINKTQILQIQPL